MRFSISRGFLGALVPFLVLTAPVAAWAVDPTPDPTSTPLNAGSPVPTSTPLNSGTPAFTTDPGASGTAGTVGSDSGSLPSWIWDAFNAWAVELEDVALGWVPSTPESYKLSSLVGYLHTAFPAGPWFLVRQYLLFFSFLFAAIGVLKALKIFWP